MKNIPHPTSPYFLHCYNPSLNQDNLSSAILHAASPLYHRSVGKILLIVSNITFALLKKLPCFLLSSEYNLKSLHWPQFWLHSHTVPLFHSPLASHTSLLLFFSYTRYIHTEVYLSLAVFSIWDVLSVTHEQRSLFRLFQIIVQVSHSQWRFPNSPYKPANHHCLPFKTVFLLSFPIT